MDDDILNDDGITHEDVVDAIADPENEEALPLLSQYYERSNTKGASTSERTKNAKRCAELLYDAKRFEDVVLWLDMIATQISDTEGPDSEYYAAFTEDEDLEALRLKATDKMLGEEEEDDDYEVEDE